MAANSSAWRDNSPSSAFIRPHPLVFYAPPPPLVTVASPFGMYCTINPTYAYNTPQPLPLHRNPRPAFPVDQSSSDEVPMVSSSQRSTETERRGNVPNSLRYISLRQPRIAVAQTTLMIKNIPNSLRRVSVLKFLDRCCQPYPELEYDFFHLPLDCMTGLNKGFAFVNFTTNDGAKKMMEILHGYKWQGEYDGVFIRCKNVCKITWLSDYQQGKEAQIRIFEKSKFKCDDDEFSPVIFDPPRNGSHPNPTPPVALRRYMSIL